MATTCGFEEANPDNAFPHISRYRELHYYLHNMNRLQPERIVATYRGYTATKSDFDTLKPQGWLNDSMMAFMSEYLQSMVELENTAYRILLLKPPVAYLLQYGRLEEIESVVRDVFQSGFIFLPVNERPGIPGAVDGQHWTLFVISIRDRKAFYFNSLGKEADISIARNIVGRINIFLKEPLVFSRLATPHQRNEYDCGVIVCEISALLIRRLLKARPGRRLSLGLGGTHFIVGAGRTFMQTLILGLYHAEYYTSERGSASVPISANTSSQEWSTGVQPLSKQNTRISRPSAPEAGSPNTSTATSEYEHEYQRALQEHETQQQNLREVRTEQLALERQRMLATIRERNKYLAERTRAGSNSQRRNKRQTNLKKVPEDDTAGPSSTVPVDTTHPPSVPPKAATSRVRDISPPPNMQPSMQPNVPTEQAIPLENISVPYERRHTSPSARIITSSPEPEPSRLKKIIQCECT